MNEYYTVVEINETILGHFVAPVIDVSRLTAEEYHPL
jgi:hypothetical protein